MPKAPEGIKNKCRKNKKNKKKTKKRGKTKTKTSPIKSNLK